MNLRPIVSSPDVLSGAPRFDGTRVDVDSILLDLELGASVDEIVCPMA